MADCETCAHEDTPKPFEVDGVDYSYDGIQQIRHNTIQLRDKALETGNMEWALILSHNVALLHYLMSLVDPSRAPRQDA